MKKSGRGSAKERTSGGFVSNQRAGRAGCYDTSTTTMMKIGRKEATCEGDMGH